MTISSKSKKKTSNSKLSSDRIVISKNQMVDGIDLLKCGNIKVGDTKTTLMDSSVSIKPNGLNDIDFDVKKKDDVRRLVVYTEIFNRKWEY
ncbi:MAG: hypothetical protein LBC54_02235 [Bacteroidales bacterium OttesenSCG-928-I14]|nr:hypothetical protein [Bacteroidales bacterium OttesenSCG-928-I14]